MYVTRTSITSKAKLTKLRREIGKLATVVGNFNTFPIEGARHTHAHTRERVKGIAPDTCGIHCFLMYLEHLTRLHTKALRAGLKPYRICSQTMGGIKLEVHNRKIILKFPNFWTITKRFLNKTKEIEKVITMSVGNIFT